MQPVTIKIQGNFYDSQIYRGKLYLWHFDGRLSVYDWDQLIRNMPTDEYLSYVKELCFLDGSYLYHYDWFGRLLEDREINNLLKDKITKLTKKQFFVSKEELAKVVIKEYDVPLGEMPLDTHIYNKKLYYTVDEGQFVSQLQGLREPISAMKRPNKIFDGRVVHMAVNNGRMAMSMLSDGLWERELSDFVHFHNNEIQLVVDSHSNFAYYNYSNIFNSSLVGDSFLVYNSLDDNTMMRQLKYERRVIDRRKSFYYGEENITGRKNGSIGWGFNDRIYYSNGKSISAVKFTGYNKDNYFHVLKDNISINEAPDEQIINAAVAYFGNIVEYMSKLIVLQSDGGVFEVSEPITRWRVFPRSLNYENHLHVILDDCLCVCGFMHDYTSNDRNKTMGAYYSNRNNY